MSKFLKIQVVDDNPEHLLFYARNDSLIYHPYTGPTLTREECEHIINETKVERRFYKTDEDYLIDNMIRIFAEKELNCIMVDIDARNKLYSVKGLE